MHTLRFLLVLFLLGNSVRAQTKTWGGNSTNAWLNQAPDALKIGRIASDWRVFIDHLTVTNPIVGNVTGSAGTATNLVGGLAGAISYQSAPGVTAFSASGTTGQAVISGGTGAPTFLTLGSAATADTSAFDPSGAAAAAQAASQPLDSDLTTISGLTPTTDNFLQAKAGAWSSRTVSQVKTDLSLSGTNTGDQTSVTGNAGTATALQTPRNINGVPFDGTAPITVTAAGSTLSDTVPISKGGTGQTNSWDAFNGLFGRFSVSYDGTPTQPVVIRPSPTSVVIPAASASGTNFYTAASGMSSDLITVNGEDLSSSDPVTRIVFDDLTASAGLSMSGNSRLRSIEFPAYRRSTAVLQFTTFSGLTNLSFPLLEYAGNSISLATFPLMTSLTFPELQYVVVTFTPTVMASLTNLSCPKLRSIGSTFSPGTMASLTNLSFPLLNDIGINFAPSTMAALTSMSFPSLKSISGTFAPTTMAAMTNLNFPAMVVYGSTIAIPSASMANVATFTMGTIGTLKSIRGATITLSGLKLSSAQVNAILALLVSLDGTNGTTLWGPGQSLIINGGTNGAPTGQGATDKATLQARGATITTS